MADTDQGFNSNDAVMPGAIDLGSAISPKEANLRQQSGGYGADGKPAPQMAVVDTQGSPAPAGKPTTPDGEPIRSLQSVDAAITGAPSGPNLKGPVLQPHQFQMSTLTPESLQRAADAGGFDSSKVPKEYWPYIQGKYEAALDPGTLDSVRNWIKGTGVGHLMAGMDAGGPQDTIPLTTMEKISPAMAEMRKVDEFFNQNIQSRIIEKGENISADGLHYTPPESYKIGKIVGSVMASPASAGGIPQAAKVMVGAALSAGGKAASTMGAYAAANPRAAQLVGELAKYTALGAIFKATMGGGGAPPP
jgi:hypothetical protein